MFTRDPKSKLFMDFCNILAKGLRFEAARACLRYGFEEIKLERIVAGANPANVASVRILDSSECRATSRPAYYGALSMLYALA